MNNNRQFSFNLPTREAQQLQDASAQEFVVSGTDHIDQLIKHLKETQEMRVHSQNHRQGGSPPAFKFNHVDHLTNLPIDQQVISAPSKQLLMKNRLGKIDTKDGQPIGMILTKDQLISRVQHSPLSPLTPAEETHLKTPKLFSIDNSNI